VAPVCNPSYSEGRDQEDHGLKPAQAYRKNRTGGVAQGVVPEFKPQQCKKKKKKKILCWIGIHIITLEATMAYNKII
jgi:hypothetical protein